MSQQNDDNKVPAGSKINVENTDAEVNNPTAENTESVDSSALEHSDNTVVDDIDNSKKPVTDECIALTGKRTKVEFDKKTIHDDVTDYMFLHPHKKRHEDKEYTRLPAEEVQKNYDSLVKSPKKVHKSHHHHSSNGGKKRMKKWKKVLLSVACVLVGIVVLLVGSVAILINNGNHQMLDTEGYSITAPDGVDVQNDGESVYYNGHTYQLNKNITSLLFLGVDKREMDDKKNNGTGGQADVLVLMAVDTTNGNTTLVNISRDTMTDVAIYSATGNYVETKTQQICLSYAYGDGKETSCDNTLTSVKRLFYNIPVNAYFALDLDGIAAINDSVGGVDVVSPETIGEFTQGQTYHLEGSQAESFVRQRDTEKLDSNNMRMQRQQTYITSFVNDVIAQTKQDFSTPLNLFNSSAEYTCTNLNPSKICFLAQNVISNNGLKFSSATVPGTVKMGDTYAEYYVNEKDFYEMFLSVYYNMVS